MKTSLADTTPPSCFGARTWNSGRSWFLPTEMDLNDVLGTQCEPMKASLAGAIVSPTCVAVSIWCFWFRGAIV